MYTFQSNKVLVFLNTLEKYAKSVMIVKWKDGAVNSLPARVELAGPVYCRTRCCNTL